MIGEMASSNQSRGTRYTTQMLVMVRDGIVSGASLNDLSAMAHMGATANPLVIIDERDHTIRALLETNTVQAVHGADVTCLAAIIAGDWVLAVTAALLIDDPVEREYALLILGGNRERTARIIEEIAEASDKSNIFFPAIVQFCCELTSQDPPAVTFANLDTERLPRSLSGLIHGMVEALNRYPVGGQLVDVCPPGSFSATCLEHVMSNDVATINPALKVLYAALTTSDVLGATTNWNEPLREAERETLAKNVDESVWQHVRVLRASAEFAAGNVDVARLLADDVPEADCLSALILLDTGNVGKAHVLAKRAALSAQTGAELIRVLTETLAIEVAPGANPVKEGDGYEVDASLIEVDSQANAASDVSTKRNLDRSHGFPRSIWFDNVDSLGNVRAAIVALDQDRLAASQKELETLGDIADRLLKKPDSYRILAKWFRLMQAERLYMRGKYAYSGRVYSYVKSLFAKDKSPTPKWVSDHLAKRMSALSNLKSTEFVS